MSYVAKAHSPILSGKWHEDETVVKCEGRDSWVWEMIDEETRFLVASHLSGTRTFEDTVMVFQKGMDTAKARPKAVFVDGSHVYSSAFNRVFYSRYKVDKVELVQRVGIRARQTNNIVERLHEILKERTRPMRGFKRMESARNFVDGYTVNYNYVREHQAIKMTPAQKAGLQVGNGWSELIEGATKQEAKAAGKADSLGIGSFQTSKIAEQTEASLNHNFTIATPATVRVSQAEHGRGTSMTKD